MQDYSASLKREGKTIGFVPTMGYLHEGHLSLVEKSRIENDVTVTSIYVNPTQFGKNEDFGKYPRDLERDKTMLSQSGCDILFLPNDPDIYPQGYQTFVMVNEITKVLEGESRPDHFKGVTTIVNILFNLVKPDRAYFGQKDAQQCAVISQMVEDLKIDVKICVMPIVRESDGLAMSSRNKYLNATEREDALILCRALNFGAEKIKEGERKTELLTQGMLTMISQVRSAVPDYIKIVNSKNFVTENNLRNGESYFILIACKIGGTRLIDNLLINL